MGWTLEDQGGGIKAWERQEGPFIAVVSDAENSASGEIFVGLYTEYNWKRETGNAPLREKEGLKTVAAAKELGREWLRAKKTREELAAGANSASRLSRRSGAPHLNADSPRTTVINWLQWNDPNGSHTDAKAEAEDLDPYDTEGAWDALENMLDD